MPTHIFSHWLARQPYSKAWLDKAVGGRPLGEIDPTDNRIIPAELESQFQGENVRRQRRGEPPVGRDDYLKGRLQAHISNREAQLRVLAPPTPRPSFGDVVRGAPGAIATGAAAAAQAGQLDKAAAVRPLVKIDPAGKRIIPAELERQFQLANAMHQARGEPLMDRSDYLKGRTAQMRVPPPPKPLGDGIISRTQEPVRVPLLPGGRAYLPIAPLLTKPRPILPLVEQLRKRGRDIQIAGGVIKAMAKPEPRPAGEAGKSRLEKILETPEAIPPAAIANINFPRIRAAAALGRGALVLPAKAARSIGRGMSAASRLKKESARIEQERLGTAQRAAIEAGKPYDVEELAFRPEGVIPRLGDAMDLSRPPVVEPARGLAVAADRPLLPGEAMTPPMGPVRPTGAPSDEPLKTDRLLGDLQDLGTQIEVAFQPNKARRIAEKLGNIPIEPRSLYLGVIPRTLSAVIRAGNPGAIQHTSLGKAAIGRAQILEEGAQKRVAAMSHAGRIGREEEIFGRTNLTTGKLESGNLAGHSVNEIAENPSRFARILTPQQKQLLDALHDIEDEVLDFYRRGGVDIKEISPVEVERYAGRIVVGQWTKDGQLVEVGFVGPRLGLGAKTGAEKARVFNTVVDAESAGFVLMPYEQAVSTKLGQAIKRVADKKTADWLLENLPEGVISRRLRPGEAPLHATEVDVRSPAFAGLAFKGPGAKLFAEEFESMLKTHEAAGLWRRLSAANAIQRVFALAGDASLFTIQLLAMMYRHPGAFGMTGARFSRTLVTALVNPAASRRYRQSLIDEHRDLLDEMRGLILSDSGLEFTEALGRGGLLRPGGLFGTLAAPLRPFQQAFESAMDAAGIYMARGLRPLAQGNPQRTNDIVDYINNMRGLASSARLGVGPNQRMIESAALLAPRYRRAVAALMVDTLQGGLRGELARRAYLHLAAGVTMTWAGITIAMRSQQGWSPQEITEELRDGLNPTSGRFLLWKIGGQLIGPGSKFVSDARLLAKMAANPGNVVDFDEFGQNMMVRWVRSQLAWSPSTAWSVFTGRDYLGNPTKATDPKSWLREFGEMSIPLWLQSALFEGGTIRERAVRSAGEFFGLRAFPQQAKDILSEESRITLKKPYGKAEPHEKLLLREILRGRLIPLQQDQVERGFQMAKFFSDLDKAEEQRREGLLELGKGKFDYLKFKSIQDVAAGRRLQAGTSVEFEPRDMNDPDLNKRALAEYYRLLDPDSPTGREVRDAAGDINDIQFNVALSKLRNRYRNEWAYVIRNINNRGVPRSMLSNLPDAQRRSMLESLQARISFYQKTGRPELAALTVQLFFLEFMPAPAASIAPSGPPAGVPPTGGVAYPLRPVWGQVPGVPRR